MTHLSHDYPDLAVPDRALQPVEEPQLSLREARAVREAIEHEWDQCQVPAVDWIHERVAEQDSDVTDLVHAALFPYDDDALVTLDNISERLRRRYAVWREAGMDADEVRVIVEGA